MANFDSDYFDAVHILELGDSPSIGFAADSQQQLETGRGWRFSICSRTVCDEQESFEVIGLWNALTTGEPARCHTPGYAIELVQNGEKVFTAALCWHCNNISISGRLASIGWRNFDASSDAARALLQFCQKSVSRNS
ncbi:MAG TPA: hypothetical protein VIF60_07155 [Burkholderiaceae bacterium]